MLTMMILPNGTTLSFERHILIYCDEERTSESDIETDRYCDMVCTRAAWDLLIRFMTFDIEQRELTDKRHT
jgi:hypothetical protein